MCMPIMTGLSNGVAVTVTWRWPNGYSVAARFAAVPVGTYGGRVNVHANNDYAFQMSCHNGPGLGPVAPRFAAVPVGTYGGRRGRACHEQQGVPFELPKGHLGVAQWLHGLPEA